MHQFRLPDLEFEGPLDLLLQLIERRELDITAISVAAVADQYLELISTPGAIELSALADYLIIAAKLILIKSRMLLPQPATDVTSEEETGDDLVQQLREYKMFKQVAQFLRARQQKGWRTYPRTAPPPRPQPTALKLEGVSRDDLVRALMRALKIRPTLPQGTLTVPLSVSIDQAIAKIIALTQRETTIRFSRLLDQAQTRMEIIVTFLAILELIKRRQIRAIQEELFGDIVLIRRTDTETPATLQDTQASWE